MFTVTVTLSLYIYDFIHSDNDEAAIPRLNTAYESNIVAWTNTRILLQYFGDRFRFRLDCFVGM